MYSSFFYSLTLYISTLITNVVDLYNNYAIEKYGNVLEYIPQEQIKISSQQFDLTNNLITTLSSFCKEHVVNSSKKVIVSLF
jgi:hypothetical protein